MHYLTSIPENITPNTKCIIMLHGVGSNEGDLFELRERFGKDIAIYSLQGPFSIGTGRYAWYPVDFSSGKVDYSSQDVERGYGEIISCIEEVNQKLGIKNENIFLMGFSQGAIMSYYTLWKSPEKLGGIIALSGHILDEIDLNSVDTAPYSEKRVFVGHGSLDQVIPFTATKKVVTYTSILGVKGEIHSYAIGHTISLSEIEDIVKWINL